MQDISKIYELFSEEAYSNAVRCCYQCEEKITKVTPVYVQKWDSRRPLFSFVKTDEDNRKVEVPLTLYVDDAISLEVLEAPRFSHLFWVEPSDDSGSAVTLKFIECGSVTPLQHLDLAYDDNTLVTLKSDAERLEKVIPNRYVFDAGKYQFLFVKAYQNGSLDWNVFGINTRYDRVQSSNSDAPCMLTVKQSENSEGEKIRVISKERFGHLCFPSRFDEIEILAYETIGVTDITQASVAYDAIIEQVNKGEALTRLWEEYSAMELRVAEEEREMLGCVSYEIDGKPQDEFIRLRMLVDSKKEQNIMLRRLADEKAALVWNCDNDDNGVTYIVPLLKYNSTSNIATVKDELFRLPKRGELRLSLKGDEIVNDRRRVAMKSLFRGNKIVLKNLLFAIENKVDSMLVTDHRHIPASSANAKKFIKDKFHIDDLTPNQWKAVEMALNNTYDITVIQGPPGTGKTTVISVICFRLLELASSDERRLRRQGREINKAILASAFQNDTIEHLASKIYTHGLPTVKIGTKHIGVKAEETFRRDLAEHLQAEIDKRGGECPVSLSKELQDVAHKHNKEGEIDITLDELKSILERYNCHDDNLIGRLNDIKSSIRTCKRKFQRDIELIERIPTSVTDYNENNGFGVAMELLDSGLDLDEEQKDFLKNAPDEDADEDYVSRLCDCKEQLKSKLSHHHNHIIHDLCDEVTQLIADAALKAHQSEESGYQDEDDFIRSVLTDIKAEAESKFNSDFIRDALQSYGQTIAATNQYAGSKMMNEYQNIENVILEEAARSNPLDLLIPMVKAHCRIIMVGDQEQLPHLLETEIAERSLEAITDIDEKREKRRLYEKSLFGIIYENVAGKHARERCITLEEQFRMHPTIGDFISNTYYKDTKTGRGKLVTGSESLYETQKHHLNLPWAKDKTFVFCNVDGSKPEAKMSRSKCRREEAERVMELLDDIKTDKESKHLSVGIISFYSQQVNLLFEEAVKHGYAQKTDDGFEICPEYKTIDGETEKIRIGSVDSFQGKEFDIVILSTVRSNSERRVEGNEKRVFGFLTLRNRLNVAFSRAKKLVVVVGDMNMFNDDYAREHVAGLYEVCHNIINKEYGCSI